MNDPTFFRVSAFWLCCLAPISAQTTPDYVVDHQDHIVVNLELTLSQVIELTLAHYPQTAVTEAMSKEAEALKRRGNSWLSSAPAISFRYQTDQVADDLGLREIETQLNLPLWNWGQRTSARALAEQASAEQTSYAHALQWRIAGAVRETLWAIRLADNRHHYAQEAVIISERLLKTIRRRMELGDLAKADVLLAESDHLDKVSSLTAAEAEVMHARRNYINLTRMAQIPQHFSETLSTKDRIDAEHPALAAAQAQVERRQADLNWQVAYKNGQTPSLNLAGKTERGGQRNQPGQPGQPYIESISAMITVPFGTRTYSGPAIAQARIALSKASSQRDLLRRQLDKALHEAEHDLAVDRIEQANLARRKALALEHIRISQLAFEAAELKLIDLLKIQAQAQSTLREASERRILMQRDMARYNQAVGIQP